MARRAIYIDGEWRESKDGGSVDLVSPNTEDVLDTVEAAGFDDVDDAVRAARRAFQDPHGWAAWTPSDRAAVLRRFADGLSARTEEIAQLVSTQMGMPISLARTAETSTPVWLLQYFAGVIEHEQTEEVRASAAGGRTAVRKVPRGVVAAIAPWNYPGTMSALKYAPALAAGNSVILKPSPETLLDAIVTAECAAAAGIPAGVFTVLPGGPATGRFLVEHPGVDFVAFTGSTATGRSIAETCGRLLRPVDLELGGKSAAVLLDDVDLDAVLPQLQTAIYANNGQTCYKSSRILAPRSRYDEIVDAVDALTASLRVGSSLDPATDVGPLVTRRQREHVETLIAAGRSGGARIVRGGGRPAGLDRGWFVEPTVFADVDTDSTIGQEEVFGPVATITPYETVEDAIRLANDSRYGLAGTVWTTDHERGRAVADRLDVGVVGINDYIPDIFSPMSEVKESGYGVKAGPEGLDGYRRYLSVYL